MNTKPASILALAAIALLPGCASYINSPSARSAIAGKREAFSHALISKAYNAKPTMRFPATIAIAPMGSESVMHIRALDALGKLDSLKTLPNLRNMPMASSLLENDAEHKDQANIPMLRLRESAARLHADAVLLISVDTNATDGQVFAPLTTATLGLFPNNRYEIIATGLAALVDTRTGYVYGTLEKSAAKSGIMMVAGSDDALSRRKQQAQREAMQKLMAEFPKFWEGVVAAHRK
jgi:uncharacterized protein YbjQ (UPF0145 family)